MLGQGELPDAIAGRALHGLLEAAAAQGRPLSYEAGRESLEPLRLGPAVRVQGGHELVARAPYAGVPRRGEALVDAVRHDGHRISPGDLRGPVRGSIVHDEDLVGTEGLGLDRLEAPREVPLRVVGGYVERDAGPGVHGGAAGGCRGGADPGVMRMGRPRGRTPGRGTRGWAAGGWP